MDDRLGAEVISASRADAASARPSDRCSASARPSPGSGDDQTRQAVPLPKQIDRRTLMICHPRRNVLQVLGRLQRLPDWFQYMEPGWLR